MLNIFSKEPGWAVSRRTCNKAVHLATSTCKAQLDQILFRFLGCVYRCCGDIGDRSPTPPGCHLNGFVSCFGGHIVFVLEFGCGLNEFKNLSLDNLISQYVHHAPLFKLGSYSAGRLSALQCNQAYFLFVVALFDVNFFLFRDLFKNKMLFKRRCG